MRRCAESGYQGADKRSDGRCRNPDGDPYNCGLHWREAEREQRCVLAASVGIDVMHQIGSEGSRQRRCGRSSDCEKSQGLRKVLHLATELVVVFGYEHPRLKAKGFVQPLHDRWHVPCCRSDHESIGEGRSPKNLLARVQGNEHTAGDVSRIRFEGRRIDRAWQRVPQLQSVQYPNDGQTEILAVSLADRECSSEVDAKGLSGLPIEDRDGAVVAAQKSAAADREHAHAELFLRLDTENVEIEKAIARHDVAKQELPGENSTACSIEFPGINQGLINGQCQRRQIAASRGLETRRG